MPWTERQVRYLESSGSPLTAAQKSKMNSELHQDPSLAHHQKGSSAMKKPAATHDPMSEMREPMREMRIEIHRGPKQKVTGFTVHHHMVPKATKSMAFSENTTHSKPFGADQHEQMMDHIHEHTAAQLGGKEPAAATPSAEEEQAEGE